MPTDETKTNEDDKPSGGGEVQYERIANIWTLIPISK